MYRSKNRQQTEFPDFYLPFSGHLDPENRWIVLARLVPWELAEEIYHSQLCEDFGAPIVPSRTALGALLIKERLGLTDRETVEAIQENPYLQFFIGLEEFSQDRPFDASLMVDFRKRFGEEAVQRMGEAIALASLSETQRAVVFEEPTDDDSKPPTPDGTYQTNTQDDVANLPVNRGQLIADATCAPADIRYPTDVSLLNEAREKTDEIIDELHVPLVGKEPRPRTYRVRARRRFVAFAKKKKPGRRAILRAKKQQLGFLCRNFKAIDRLLEHPEAFLLTLLSRRMFRNFLVCRELYRQQFEMHQNNSQRVDDRIVSISQPHVRPIKRGKAGRETEFGAKLSISVVNGFSFVDRLSWDNYNEGTDLFEQVENFRRRFGFYPESVHVDKIYRTRANRAFCKVHGIRISGPPLGRPPKHVSAKDKKQAMADERVRQRVEGKFGQAKRRFGLGRVMAKLANTSQAKRRFGLGRVMAKLANTSAAQISLSFLVMNLELALKRFSFSLVLLCHGLARLAFNRRTACRQPFSHQRSRA